MPRSSDPPPVITMPRSTMSEASSGGVFSRDCIKASTICWSGSLSASRTSTEEIFMVLGIPATRSRPLISISSSCSSRNADPMRILICSAVCSPMRRL